MSHPSLRCTLNYPPHPPLVVLLGTGIVSESSMEVADGNNEKAIDLYARAKEADVYESMQGVMQGVLNRYEGFA